MNDDDDLLDLNDDAPGPSPDQQAALDRRLFAAVAADRRRWAQRRLAGRILGAASVAACLAAALALALHLTAPPTPTLALVPQGLARAASLAELPAEPESQPEGVVATPEPSSSP